jgi:hypothetical protein
MSDRRYCPRCRCTVVVKSGHHRGCYSDPSSGQSLPWQTAGMADLKAAYRLLDCADVTLRSATPRITEDHFAAPRGGERPPPQAAGDRAPAKAPDPSAAAVVERRGAGAARPPAAEQCRQDHPSKDPGRRFG